MISELMVRMNSWIFGGQFGSLEASPRMRARSARSLYPQMWMISLSGPIYDLRAHGADELLDLRWPVRILGGLAPDARALREVLVPPDVDDLVERPDL